MNIYAVVLQSPRDLFVNLSLLRDHYRIQVNVSKNKAHDMVRADDLGAIEAKSIVISCSYLPLIMVLYYRLINFREIYQES